MTQQDQLETRRLETGSFIKPILIGAVVAFLVISLFVFGLNNPAPEWGRFWKIRPLIITPLAGAVGGAFYAYMQSRVNRGFNRTAAVLISLLVYIIGVWLGVVLGLDGTLWD